MAATLFGVDVSVSQGTVDWAGVKAGGMTFAVARCVRETGAVDRTYATNVAGAKQAGLIAGAYAFLVGDEAAAQAKTFIDAVGDPKGMLIMVDIERPLVEGHPVPAASDVKAFVAAWKQAHPTHPILLYGSHGSIFGSIAKGQNFQVLGPMWLAFYRKGHTHTPQGFYDSIGGNAASQWNLAFGGWAGPTIWQFTDGNIHVPGIQKPDGTFIAVDTNAFRGTRAQLLALTDPAGAGATKPATPAKPAAPAKPATATGTMGANAAGPAKPSSPAQSKKVFHIVKPGETLSGIATQFGFGSFGALIAKFPENHPFQAHPGLIHPGDRVRVR